MVYVLNREGKPLMPTERHGKVRRMLRDGRAVVVQRTPFTIRLTYDTTNYVQDVTLGVDPGSKHAGLSATTETEELYSAEVTLKTDIKKQLESRREARRTRRSRKTRYRAPRFDNRRKSDGWLTPSIENRIGFHLNLIRKVCAILPVKHIVIETSQFDMQKIQNPDIEGAEYQQGEQYGFWNLREYILWRDHHTCQCCHGKSKDPVLNVHHIESRKTGSDRPGNLITLCETCHKGYHAGRIDAEFKPKPCKLDGAAHVSIMRWELYRRAKKEFGSVTMMYGFMTKHIRIENGLPKSERIDAKCISGHPAAKPCGEFLLIRQVPRHSRSLHVFKPGRKGARRSAVASHWIGKTRFQQFDLVEYQGIKAFVSGSSNGRPILRTVDGKLATSTATASPKKVKFIYRKHGSYLLTSNKMQSCEHIA